MRVLGHHGVGRQNEMGPMLLRMCMQHGILITNTDFNKMIAERRRGCIRGQETGILLIMLLSDVRNIENTTAWSDHRLDKIKTGIRTPPKITRMPPSGKGKKLHTKKLKNLETREQFRRHIDEAFSGTSFRSSDIGIEDRWTRYSELERNSAERTLVARPKQIKDWFDERDP